MYLKRIVSDVIFSRIEMRATVAIQSIRAGFGVTQTQITIMVISRLLNEVLPVMDSHFIFVNQTGSMKNTQLMTEIQRLGFMVIFFLIPKVQKKHRDTNQTRS